MSNVTNEADALRIARVFRVPPYLVGIGPPPRVFREYRRRQLARKRRRRG